MVTQDIPRTRQRRNAIYGGSVLYSSSILPTVKYDELETIVRRTLRKNVKNVICSTCRNHYEKRDNVSILPCGHMYHDDCIYSWLRCHGTCPMCRSDVATSEIKSLSDDTRYVLRKQISTTAKLKARIQHGFSNLSLKLSP